MPIASESALRTKAGVRQLLQGVNRSTRLKIVADVVADLEFSHAHLLHDELVRIVTGQHYPDYYQKVPDTRFIV